MSATQFAFSSKAGRTRPQPVTPLMAAALGRKDLISLAVGFVDSETLPAKEVRGALDAVLAGPSARASLQYGTTQGLAELRKSMVDHIARLDQRSPEHHPLSPENVVITTGSQQGLYILADILIDPGDIVITAAPSYFVYTAALASFGAEIYSVGMDESGMRIDLLERTLTDLQEQGRLDCVKMIYVTTYYQNPTGLSLAVDRRPRIVEVAERFSRSHRILVLEDAAYRELRYDGPETPSILSFDPTGQWVAMAASFSKSLSPGMKTGCLLLPEGLLEAVMLQKGNHDFGSPNLLQYTLAEMLRTGAYESHVQRLRTTYRGKRDTMLAALRQGLAGVPGVRWTEPGGGLYVWLTLPECLDAGAQGRLFNACLERDVLYVPGEYCFTARPDGAVPSNTMRLSYGLPDLQDIREGVRRLAEVIRAQMESVCAPSTAPKRFTV
jgi:2-aminoadipate transaminase